MRTCQSASFTCGPHVFPAPPQQDGSTPKHNPIASRPRSMSSRARVTPVCQSQSDKYSQVVGCTECLSVWSPMSCIPSAAITSSRPLARRHRAFSPTTHIVAVKPSSVTIRATSNAASSASGVMKSSTSTRRLAYNYFRFSSHHPRFWFNLWIRKSGGPIRESPCDVELGYRTYLVFTPSRLNAE